ncbi:hypothetical protein SELMODRAFT_405932 [Selaginella moellendorffii]|uniref:Uncharacterized protein n=1 Tax=Selaginella moellendorffii TaxID=88036 RepID=D8R048_SELML|nr:hypothetical protein SELMODRAFT_405932 [Selaginella moellendorffii]
MPPSLWIGSARRRWASFWNRMVPWDLDHHILGNDHLNPPPPPHMIIPTSNNNQHHVVLKHKYVVALFLFLVCVDLIEIVGVLCYQLFTASYFPWHLYPMMLNRAMEIIALICSRGYIPSLYSAAQILLSLLSLAVYAKRQPCGRYHCAVPLVLYSILLSYEVRDYPNFKLLNLSPFADLCRGYGDQSLTDANGQRRRPYHRKLAEFSGVPALQCH